MERTFHRTIVNTNEAEDVMIEENLLMSSVTNGIIVVKAISGVLLIWHGCQSLSVSIHGVHQRLDMHCLRFTEYQVLTILHQLVCRGVANFGTRCI